MALVRLWCFEMVLGYGIRPYSIVVLMEEREEELMAAQLVPRWRPEAAQR